MHRFLTTLILLFACPALTWAGPIDEAQVALRVALAQAAVGDAEPVVDDAGLERELRSLESSLQQVERGSAVGVQAEMGIATLELVLGGGWCDHDHELPQDSELAAVVVSATSLERDAVVLLAMIDAASAGAPIRNRGPGHDAGVSAHAEPVAETSSSAAVSADAMSAAAAPALPELDLGPAMGLTPLDTTDDALVLAAITQAHTPNALAFQGTTEPVLLAAAAPVLQPEPIEGGDSGQERWLTPLEEPRVTSVFGMRVHPVTHRRRMHRGIDYGAPTGTPVLATATGEVLMAGWCGRGPGNCVVIEHADGWRSQYFHLDEVHAEAGDTISQGTVLGTVGDTGLATGPHLHFQLGQDGTAVDPALLLGTPVGVLPPPPARVTGSDS